MGVIESLHCPTASTGSRITAAVQGHMFRVWGQTRPDRPFHVQLDGSPLPGTGTTGLGAMGGDPPS